MERLRRLRLNGDGGERWFSTAASIWIQCTAGSLYTFSIYSQALKSSQSYDQSTLDTVSVSKDIGANSGVISGVLYSYVSPDHRDGRRSVAGPWVVLLAGAIQCFAGYFLMWMSTVGLISRPPVPLMCFFMLLAAHAQTFFNTTNVVTAVRNFPRFSGTAVGIMKGFVGLSGAILVQTYQVISNNHPTTFLLILACLPTANALLLMWFVRVHETSQRDEQKHLNRLSLVALVIAAYLMVVLILENLFTFHITIRFFTFAFLLVLLASPLCVALQARREGLNNVSERPLLEECQLTDGLGDELGADSEDMNGGRRNMPPPGEDMNLLQSLQTLNFWILFFAMACGMGSGLSTVNNMNQIGKSLGYSSFEISTLVSLWSIWNFLGRFGAGYISDYFLRVRSRARPLSMVITLGVMSIGYLMIASGLHGTLYAGSVLVGVCYGSQWSLMPTIASEIFGVRHMGTVFNAITIANPVGTYIFSVRVIGYFYDKESSGEANRCIGIHCFMLSFLIMAFATLCGSLAAFMLFLRTKAYYNEVILRRMLDSERR